MKLRKEPNKIDSPLDVVASPPQDPRIPLWNPPPPAQRTSLENEVKIEFQTPFSGGGDPRVKLM